MLEFSKNELQIFCVENFINNNTNQQYKRNVRHSKEKANRNVSH